MMAGSLLLGQTMWSVLCIICRRGDFAPGNILVCIVETGWRRWGILWARLRGIRLG